jgi:hypothetical protein
MSDDRGELDLTKQIEVLTQKVHDAELETSLVKAVGMNSPEMKTAQKRIKELENSLSISLDINEQQQRDLKIKDDEIGRLYNKIQR